MPARYNVLTVPINVYQLLLSAMSQKINIAIALTWFRIAAIPMFVAVFLFAPGYWARPASMIIFTIAGFTDWLDGYLARKLHQTSRFGAFLDPVADKLMVTTALVLVVQGDPKWYIALAAAIIIGREIAVSALREWMAEIGARSQVAVSRFGKIKTLLQMVGLGAMLYLRPIWGFDMYTFGLWLLTAAAALTLWSMIDYIRAAWPSLSSA